MSGAAVASTQVQTAKLEHILDNDTANKTDENKEHKVSGRSIQEGFHSVSDASLRNKKLPPPTELPPTPPTSDDEENGEISPREGPVSPDSDRPGSSKHGTELSNMSETPILASKAKRTSIFKDIQAKVTKLSSWTHMGQGPNAAKEVKVKRNNYRDLVASKTVINPHSSFMRNWDLLSCVLLAFVALVTPYEVSFLVPAWNALYWINRIVDLCFIVDMGITFCLAIYDRSHGMWVFDHKSIAQAYLGSWFIIDFVSILPFDTVGLVMESNAVAQLKLLRIVRLFKLAKLLRLLRAGRILDRFESAMTINYSALSLLKFAMVTMLCAHWLACAFALVENLENAKESWLVSAEDGLFEDGRGTPAFKKYIAALYWSVMTMSTIGYGDIMPRTTVERVYVIICMFLGAFSYGYVIGAVSGIISTRDSKINRYYALMDELNALMEEFRLDHDLRIKLRQYFKYRAFNTDYSGYHSLLTMMSPALQGEVAIATNTNWINQVKIFRMCNSHFVAELVLSLQELVCPPLETVVHRGDLLQNLYIIKKGILLVGGRLSLSGDVFGEESLHMQGVSGFSAHTMTYCQLLYIQAGRFIELLDRWPKLQDTFRIYVIKIIAREEMMAYTAAYNLVMYRKKIMTSVFGDTIDPDRVKFYERRVRAAALRKVMDRIRRSWLVSILQRRWRRKAGGIVDVDMHTPRRSTGREVDTVAELQSTPLGPEAIELRTAASENPDSKLSSTWSSMLDTPSGPSQPEAPSAGPVSLDAVLQAVRALDKRLDSMHKQNTDLRDTVNELKSQARESRMPAQPEAGFSRKKAAVGAEAPQMAPRNLGGAGVSGTAESDPLMAKFSALALEVRNLKKVVESKLSEKS